MEIERTSGVLACLGQPTRLEILQLLAPYSRGETARGVPAGHISDALNLAPATLSFHLKDLLYRGLVSQKREGRVIRYRANISAVATALEYVVTEICGVSE
jgi:ArsR family transcriptional regulator, arsenate/arsenite/antimonite-responsive transcriptional repressor